MRHTGYSPLQHARRSATGFLVVQGASKFLGLSMALLAANASTPADFGYFVLGVLVAAVVTTLADFGASGVIMRTAALAPHTEDLRKFVSDRVTYLYLLTCLAYVAASLLADKLRFAALTLAIGLHMASDAICAATLIGAGKGARAGFSNLAFNFAGSLFLLTVLLRFNGSATGPVLLSSYAVGSMAATSANLYSLRRCGLFRIPRRLRWATSPDTALAGRTATVQILIMLGSYIDQLLLGFSGQQSAMGQYGLATRFKDIATALPAIITAGFQTYFVAGMEERATKFFQNCYYALVILCSSLGAALALTGPWIITNWMPPAYASANQILTPLAAGLYASAVHILSFFLVRGLAGERIKTGHISLLYSLLLGASLGASALALLIGDVKTLAMTRSLVDIVGYTCILHAILRLTGNAVPPLMWLFSGLATAGTVAAYIDPTSSLISVLLGIPGALALIALRYDPKDLDPHEHPATRVKGTLR